LANSVAVEVWEVDVSKLQNADNCRKIPYRSSACRRGCSVALAAADLPDNTLTRNIKLKEGVLTLPEQFPDVGSCNAHPKADNSFYSIPLQPGFRAILGPLLARNSNARFG
jgi:hypothetical protein